MRCGTFIIILFLSMLVGRIYATDANSEKPNIVKWYEEVSNQEVIKKEAKKHGVYLRLVSFGSWAPENACYEYYADLTPEQMRTPGNGKYENISAKFSQTGYGNPVAKEKQPDVLALLWLMDDLVRNDILTLPSRTEYNDDIVVFRIEDPYRIFVYLKIGDKTVCVCRESYHDLLRHLHNKLQEMWTRQPPVKSWDISL